MTYKLFNEGEEIGEFESLQELRDFVAVLRDEHTDYEAGDMKMWPSHYPPDYVAGEGFDEYFRDVYEVYQVIDVKEVL